MPDANIIWSAVGGFVVMLLGTIAYLIRTGISKVLAEIEKLWDYLTEYHDKADRLERRQDMLEAKCEERHKERK